MNELNLQVLGSFRVQDAKGTEVRIASRKGRALLAYLALRPGESHSRDRLATLLWEDADEELARTSLRQALAALRKSLPANAHKALLADTESVGIDPAVVRSDLHAFRHALTLGTRTALQEAMTHYRGDLLDGFDARSTAFDEWLTSERLTLRKELSDALHKLADLCAANGDSEGALAACTKLVALEPLNEAAHRRVMDLHAKRNAYAEALRQYRVCRDVLRRELDVAPEPATEQLYRDLMRRRRAALGTQDDDDTALDDTARHEAPRASEPAAPVELRPQLIDATIMVARLEGLLELEAQLDPEESHTLATQFHRRVQESVTEFGGRVDRRVGSNVLAVFGIPTAYGNEPERATQAALALQSIVASTPWPAVGALALRIGIAQGQVLCAAEIFPLTGRPTHIAHTLAARAADGEILISEELRASLGERVSGTRAASALPGQSESVIAWSLQGLRSEIGPGAQPFVGRRPELAMVLAALDRCTNSRHGRAIVVRGEAGIGKTSLVNAVRGAARERGVAVHSAQVFDFGQSPGRRPITALALSLLGLAADASANERAAAVRRATAGRNTVDQIIFLSDLIDAPIDAELAALEKAMEIATRQRGRALALAQLIESAVQRGPQLLVVEDVHWADTDELARFGEIAAVVANCQILFIMTTRPEGDPINASWRARARGCPVTTVDLAPLAEDEAQELAAHFPELSPETIDACIQRAEGHPLFLDQLLRAARAGHDLLPGSVRSVVLARAARLSGRDHSALQAAAVLGHRAALDALRRVVGNDDYDPTPLTETALVRFNGVELEFVHALFRDAIYESTLKSQRRELHRTAADWYASGDPALRADHLAAADDERATTAYLEASLAEQAALRFERALGLVNKASALAREPVLLHKCSLLLGELLLQLGRTHDALTSYREALDFAIDQHGHGTAWIGIAAALRIMDRHEEALDALDHAETALGESADLETRARVYTLRGNLCFPLGRLDACMQAHEQAHRFALQAKSHVELARALSGLGDAYYQRGSMITAREHFARCVKEARDHDLVGVLLSNLPMMAVTHTFCGDPEASSESCREGLELARRVGDLRGELLVHLTLASGMLLQAQMDDCRRHARQALQLAKQLGARRFEAECVGIIAASMMIEDPAQALQLAREALQFGRETGMSYCGPMLLSLVARLTPAPEERASLLAEGNDLLAAGCVSHSYFEFYGNAIDVGLQERDWTAVRDYAGRLEAYTAAEPLPWTDMLIKRARLLADAGEKGTSKQTRAGLESLQEECQRMKAGAALTAIEAALSG
ncbi:MAG TPA: AAA family ATPase [Steroidobacteraceae bacterium]|nr:AAA family ATPase [Steroidobacteraceae bacterium]